MTATGTATHGEEMAPAERSSQIARSGTSVTAAVAISTCGKYRAVPTVDGLPDDIRRRGCPRPYAPGSNAHVRARFALLDERDCGRRLIEACLVATAGSSGWRHSRGRIV